MLRISCFFIFTFILAVKSYATDDIAIMGLIADKAILRIDGVHQVIKQGESTKEGIKLIQISENRKTVLLEINDEKKEFRLGHGTNTGAKTVKLIADKSGVYKSKGKINDKAVPFIIDTGATYVSLSSEMAATLGIELIGNEKKLQAETANGVVPIYIVNLDSVTVGDIKINNVEAAIHEGKYPTMGLLGMSFLKKLKMEREGETLILHKN